MSMFQIDPKEIRRLWILKLIAEQGTIKRAAIAAQLTSSAVSQSLSAMEITYNRKLLNRQGEKFVLTPFGQGLLRAANPTLIALQDLHEYLNPESHALPKLTSLTLGTTQSIAIEILPGLVDRLRQKHPKIKIHLKVGRSAALCRAVKKGELQVAIVAENEQTEGLDILPIANERMGFYCSSRPEILSQGWKLIETKGIGAFPPDSGGYPSYFRKLFKHFGPSWKANLYSESYEALRALAVNGSMVSVLSTRVAAVSQGELTELIPPELQKLSQAEREKIGSYPISLVSDRSLDPAQIGFLANELRAVLHD